MNILLINHYAGSPELGMEYRPYYLAKEWLKLGHDITIIASDVSHVRTRKVEVRYDFKEQYIDGVRYLWVKTPKYEGNGMKRFQNILTFTRKLNKNAKYLAEKYKPDIVIASSTYPSDNYAASKIAKLSNAKHIYEVHDLWPLSPMELGGMSKKNPFIIYMQRAEDFAYKNVDYVVSLLPKTKRYMASRGLDTRKWIYIPNGVLLNDWEDTVEVPKNHANLISKLKAKGSFVVLYAGSHGVANALNCFVDSAMMLQNKNVDFVLVGKGPEKDALIKSAQHINNIHFLDAIPKKAIPNMLSLADVLYVGLQKQNLFRFGISPNKLIDYMMSSKPIIQAIDAGNDMVKEADCGLSIGAENSQLLSKAVLELKECTTQQREEMGKRAKKYVVENHNFEILAKSFIDEVG